MRLLSFLYVLLSLFFTSCENKSRKKSSSISPSKSVLGSWQLYNMRSAGQDDKQAAPEGENPDVMPISGGNMYSFFPDSTYTLFSGSDDMITGKWWYINGKDAIMLTDFAGSKARYIMHDVNNQQQLLILTNPESGTVYSYVQYATSMVDYEKDPFYLPNNTWRLSPDHPENSEALKKRLAGYFKHVLCILRAADLRSQPSVSFFYSEGPLQIYGSGIGIKPENSIDESWEKCFYDKKDAHKIYVSLQKYLYNTHYKGKGTGNWMKDDYRILSSILDDLKANKFPADSL